MDFTEANVDGRQRLIVRGRVLVFTTSLIVEFLQNDLRRSWPLYSTTAPYPTGFGLSFLVELDGYLTFDQGAYVKVSAELNPYQQFYYDPTASLVVYPADVVLASPVVVVTGQKAIGHDGNDATIFFIQFSDSTSAYYLGHSSDEDAKLIGVSKAELLPERLASLCDAKGNPLP